MNDKIVILLSTYNGEEYLQNQIDSILQQSYVNWKILARDDGSSDNTVAILEQHAHLLASDKNVGPKKSFELLLAYALKNSDSDYFMFCDQDDVWNEDKIEKTLQKMKKTESIYPDTPVLIHTDLEIVDENLRTIHPSFWEHDYILPKYNSLSRLLVQNTVTGCTVMINRKLAEMALPIPDEAIMHDWWIALVASYFGKIGYLDKSYIKYRQHSANNLGAKGFSYVVEFKKLPKIFYKNRLFLKHLYINFQQARAFLKMYREKLDQNTINMFEDFIVIETMSFWKKRKVLFKYGLFKQGLIRNIEMVIKI